MINHISTQHPDGSFVLEKIPPSRWNVQRLRYVPEADYHVGKRVRSRSTNVRAGETVTVLLDENSIPKE